MRSTEDIRTTGAAWVTEQELDALCAENERLRAAIEEFLTKGLKLTPDGLMVIKSKYRSDPHYRLCELIWPKGRRAALEPQP